MISNKWKLSHLESNFDIFNGHNSLYVKDIMVKIKLDTTTFLNQVELHPLCSEHKSLQT